LLFHIQVPELCSDTCDDRTVSPCSACFACCAPPCALQLSIDVIHDLSINRHVPIILQGHRIVGDFSSSEGISAAVAAHWLGGIDILILNIRRDISALETNQ